MIVACEACSTEFKLDDAKVPARGIRVRCSRCKHTFLVCPESPKEEPPEVDVSGGDEDWQFNDDVSQEGEADVESEASTSVRSAIDDLLGSQPIGQGEGAGDADPIQNAVSDLLGGGDPPSEDLGSSQEEDPPGDDGDEREEGLFAPPDSQLVADPDPDAGTEVEVEGLGPADATPSGLSLDGPAEEIQESSDAAVEEVPQPATAIARIALQKAPARSEVKPRPRRRAGFSTGPSALSIWAGRAAHALGWLATLALVGATVWDVVTHTRAEVAAAPPTQRVNGFDAESLEGRWIENLWAPIYVVSGTLQGGSSQSARGPLGVRLLDAAGEPIDRDLARVGPELDASALREWPLEDLRLAQAKGAREWAATPLAPDERRRFHAVFESPPQDAAFFRLETMSLDPAAGAAD